MTSINRNVPTKTNYVPTTTQQPTSTNTTVTGSGVASTGSSVPTPTSSVVYTASVPNTSVVSIDSELDAWKKAYKEAEFDFNFWNNLFEKVHESTEKRFGVRKLEEQIRNEKNPAKKAELEKKLNDICNDPDYRECQRLIGAYCAKREEATARWEFARRRIEELEKKKESEVTVTAYVPASTAGVPATPNVTTTPSGYPTSTV